MNVIKLMGGLGNQMFQYAFGRVMKEKGIPVAYDTSWYNKPTENRPYLLNYFETNIKKVNFLPNQNIIHETGYRPQLFTLMNKNFRGYWQYYNYYEKYLSIFQNEFTLHKDFYTPEFECYLNEIKSVNSVGIHIRRGDYLNKNFPVMPISYYVKALSLCINEIDSVYIFSDDPAWCKQNTKNATIIHLTPFFDFELLKNCKYQIISSSTFSWWAAWLNPNKNKKVICPKQFIVRKEDQLHYDNKIHYPNDWIKI